MTLYLDRTMSAGRSAYQKLFGGRIARTTFVIRASVLSAVIYLMFAPLGTILAPSSKILTDFYLVLFFGILALCLLGLVSAYVKRLHDVGFRGYWAIVALIVIPGLILWGLSAYSGYRWRQDHSFNTADVNNLSSWIAFGLPLLFALWRGEAGENIFGSVPPSVEHFTASKFNIAAVGGAAAILIPLSIYVGLFQQGVWIGRGTSAPPMPFIGSAGEGTVFMKCWNLKGVGAGSGEGPLSGVYRDGYKSVFDFVQLPDGRIDIVPVGGQVVERSYIADGFKIRSYGLNLPEDRLKLIEEKLNVFMLVATFDEGGTGAATNVTNFTFGRSEKIFPSYHVVMSSAIISSANAGLGVVEFPPARGRLMIGDCMAG